MPYGALLLAGLVHLAATATPPVCVLADERGENRRAADAAMETLGDAVRIDVSAVTATGFLAARCSGVLAVGPAALAVARAQGVQPVVAVLVPNVRPAEDTTLSAAVPMEADPESVLTVLSELAPGVRRIGLVYDPAITGPLVARAKEVAEARDLEIVALEAEDQAAAIRAFHRFERELAIDALWILPDRTTTTFETAHQALKLAHWKRIPVVGPSRWYVANGALFALEPGFEAHGRAAAEHLRAVMDDGDRAPVVYAPGAALLVNQRTVNRLGLRISPQVRPQVTEVIQ
jgi:putative tryptophan/tyrosine transport system substrate-binding protein